VTGTPLVSVIIVNWNGKQYIDACLGSLAAQTHPNLETIFVDNASCDGSAEYVRSQYPSLILVANVQNLGFAGGNNSGLPRATGKYVCLLNNDAIAAPDWIARLVQVAEADSGIGMLASKVLFREPAGMLNSTGTLVYPDLSCLNRGMFEMDQGQYDQSPEVFGPYGAAAFYRKAALDQVGLFDGEYFMHREEDDLNWRLRLAGWECRYVPEAVVTHLWSVSSGGGGSSLKLYYGERNRVWNLFKFMPPDMILASGAATFRRLLALSRTLKPANADSGQRRTTRLSRAEIVVTLLRAWFAAGLRYFHFRAKRPRGVDLRARVRELLVRYGATLNDIIRTQVSRPV
jgi:GT2 family glycosyltransferase